MTRRLRLAHVVTRLDLGGAQQNTLHCTRHHDRARFDVTLIAGAGGRLDADAESIPSADVRLVPWLRHPISPVSDLAAVFRLRSLFRSRAIDIVHTHSSKAGILGRAAARLARVPVVIHTVHGWSFNDTQRAATRRAYVAMERLAARWTDRLIVVSRRNRDTGLDLRIGTTERYRTIRSGIDRHAYRRPRGVRDAVRAALGVGPDDIVVGCVGNLKPQKDPLAVVETAALARDLEPRLRFVVVGDGPLRREVERRIQARNLADRVELLGWRDDVPDVLQAFDVYLLLSRFEGLPRSVLQAMAAGIPVVATAVDGTPEVVRDGETGLLVPVGDPDAAARAVARLASDRDLADRLRANAQHRLGDEFDIGRMVGDLETLYVEIARERDLDAP